MLLTLLIFLLIGGTAGFFAGLFGIGAGILMVPALHEMFLSRQWSADVALRLALGTSMASIIFSSISSLRAHHRHGAVLWTVVISITPGILIGTLGGSLLASAMPTRALVLFFVAFLIFIAIQIAGWNNRDLPGWSIGYVYLPALLAIVAASSLTAPLGANMAHRLPARPLKRAFAALLLLLAARMIFKLFD